MIKKENKKMNIKEYIQKYNELLPVGTSISYTEAERRAGEFLSARATINDMSFELGKEKLKLTTIQTVVYANLMSKGTAKTVTENKLTAEANEEYIKAREDLEDVENTLKYLRTQDDIFKDAHIYYRSMAKESNS